MNLLPQQYQGATPVQQRSYMNTYERLPFPVESLPSIIRKAIIATCVNKKVPLEIAASVFLSAASLSCLPLTEVIPVHTTIPEPAVLNFLIIAKSGLGKSTVLKPVMQVFHDFSSQANGEYKDLLKKYEVEIALWREKEKALARNLRQAIQRNYSGEDECRAMENHLQNKPQKPVRFKFLYQDVSPAALLNGLNDNPEAGIIMEEAVTFFNSRAKNDPGILNLGWDGSPYSYQRKGVDYEIIPRLMFCLMSQPDIFYGYIAQHHDTARGSGFLARFLMVKVDDNHGYEDGDFSHMLPAIEAFDNRVRELLEQAKQRFYYGITDKQQLTLSPQAIAFMGEKRAEMLQKIAEGGPWEHIADIAQKSGSNILRLAAIFHCFMGQQTEEISITVIEHAYKVIEWYMQQVCRVFYHDTKLFQFEKDVLEVYYWIHNKMVMERRAIISKSEIMRLGPKHKSNNLREARKLVPILEQLAWQKRILLLQNARGGSIYTILPNQWGVFQDPSVRIDIFPHGCRCLPTPEIPGRVALNLPNLFFTW
ncbi:YfjI family protein [Serratia fonticola]|uniref:YfjI family protein n=1 Tax=Serratia fonticola TaxID=47917 RepID=UPI001648EBF0|nr:YfjI family protein [Serratia fonticola]MBC3228948.1 DUF3987 domain-containing protein [Serratia fonticola]